MCEAHFVESVKDLRSQIDKLELPNIITEMIQNGFASEGGGPALAPSRPSQPAPSAHSPKKDAQTSAPKAHSSAKTGGKQYGCFLSHHKAACAMEGEAEPARQREIGLRL